MLSSETQKAEITDPIFCLIEAKYGEIDKGYAQCGVEMYLAAVSVIFRAACTLINRLVSQNQFPKVILRNQGGSSEELPLQNRQFFIKNKLYDLESTHIQTTPRYTFSCKRSRWSCTT